MERKLQITLEVFVETDIQSVDSVIDNLNVEVTPLTENVEVGFTETTHFQFVG